jgi:hypothetical protein
LAFLLELVPGANPRERERDLSALRLGAFTSMNAALAAKGLQL